MGRLRLSNTGMIEAFSMKYYQGFNWVQKNGDYYVIGRSSTPFQLCKIIEISDKEVKTIFCDTPENVATWTLDEFKGFNVHRLLIHPFMFNHDSYWS